MDSSQLRAREPKDKYTIMKSTFFSNPCKKGVPYRPPVFTLGNTPEYPENSLSEGQRFALFTNLPAELQLEIWAIAAAAPQIYRLDSSRKYSNSSLLVACQASREVFLKARSNKCSLGEKDLVVLGRTFNDSQRIEEANKIRHLAIHYDTMAHRVAELRSEAAVGRWLVQLFPRLRTWELYSDWIDSLDQQRVRDNGFSTITGPDVVWLPPYKGLRLDVCIQLLRWLDRNPERPSKSGLKKRLVGRPIFDIISN